MCGLLEWNYVAEKDCHSRTIVGLYNASYRSPSAFNRADLRCIQSKEQRPYRALAADTALGWFSTIEEAKAACEADFAQRLMQVPAVRELVEKAQQINALWYEKLDLWSPVVLDWRDDICARNNPQFQKEWSAMCEAMPRGLEYELAPFREALSVFGEEM